MRPRISPSGATRGRLTVAYSFEWMQSRQERSIEASGAAANNDYRDRGNQEYGVAAESTFNRFVSIGRVALVNYGPDSGKIATIIDVVDENKALIDGPFSVTGVNRQVISFKRLALTDLTVKIPRQAREATLKKALAADGTVAKWDNTTWAKKIANKKTRAELSDFDRFKTMIARKQKSSLIKKTIAAARKN